MVVSLRNLLVRGNQARPQVAGDACVYAVGDLHGRHDLLIDMLKAIVEDFETLPDDRHCRLIFLGDYVDRGDQSREVLETLRRLTIDGIAPMERIVALKGNHEEALLDFIDAPLEKHSWLDFGAKQTLASYGIAMPQRPDAEELALLRDQLVEAMGPHVDFLRTLRHHSTSGDVIFTHAGVAPGDAALHDLEAMLWGHPKGVTDWPAPGKLVVHGHYDCAEATNRPGRICVDTGAYYTGRLTAVRLDADVSFLTVSR